MKALPNAVVPNLVKAKIALVSVACLAACAPQNPAVTALEDGPFAPPVATEGDAVDGIVVGNRLMDAGEHELALKSFYRAAAEDGLTPEVIGSIGSANLQLGRLDQAELQLRRAVREDPTYVSAWNNLGVLLMEKGEYSEAARVFEKAFALDSGNSDDIRSNLRLALEKAEQMRYPLSSENNEFDLVWQGSGSYKLVAPDTGEGPDRQEQ